MMGKIIDFLLGRKKSKVKVIYNSEDLNQSEKLQSILNENAYLKGILAKQKSEEGKLRESKKDDDEEKERIKELNEQKEKLDKKDLQPFDLFKLFKFIEKRKNKGKIVFTTFDGSKVLGPVTSFCIMPDGAFGCVSNGEVVWASKDINHVFWWMTGLNNFAKKKMIPLCVNSKGQFEINIQTEEMSQLVRDSDGKFRINRFNKKPVYEMVSELHEQISDLNGELESTEEALSEQQKEINEKDRESKLHKSRADKVQSELSMALHKVAEIEMANGMIQRQNMALINMKEINETLIDAFETLTDKYGNKIEEVLSGPSRDREWEDIKKKLSFAKENLGNQYNYPPEVPKPSLSESVKPVKT